MLAAARLYLDEPAAPSARDMSLSFALLQQDDIKDLLKTNGPGGSNPSCSTEEDIGVLIKKMTL